MADQVAMLMSAERVDCRLCGVTFPGSEFREHDAAPEHQRRKGQYIVARAVRRVDGWAGCAGRIEVPKGNLRLDV